MTDAQDDAITLEMAELNPDEALGDILTLLTQMDLTDASEGAPAAELAIRLDIVMRSMGYLKDLRDALELVLIDTMEESTLVTPEVVVHREPTVRSTWKPSGAARMREDIKHAVANNMALDVETGEVNVGRRNVINAAIDELWAGVPAFSSIKQATPVSVGTSAWATTANTPTRTRSPSQRRPRSRDERHRVHHRRRSDRRRRAVRVRGHRDGVAQGRPRRRGDRAGSCTASSVA